MDFFTHLLVGIVLGRIFFKDPNKQKVMAFGSILPDLDVFLAWVPFFIPNLYIFSHRGLFHSLITLLFFFPLIVFILNKLLQFNKFQMARGTLSLQITLSSYIIGIIGCYLHLFMDLLNPQGVVLFSPLSEQRFTLSTMNFIEPFVSIPATLVLVFFSFKRYYKKQTISINRFDLLSRSITVIFVIFILLNSFLIVQTVRTQKTDITSPGWILINRWVVVDQNDTFTVKLVNQLTQGTERTFTFNKISFNSSEITNQKAEQLITKAKESIQYKKFHFSLDPNTRLLIKVESKTDGNWNINFADVIGKAQQMYYNFPDNSFFQDTVRITVAS